MSKKIVETVSKITQNDNTILKLGNLRKDMGLCSRIRRSNVENVTIK